MILSFTVHSNYSDQLNVIFPICNMPLVIALLFQYLFALPLHILAHYIKITIAVYQSPMSFSDILKRPTKINQNSPLNK